MYCELGLKTSGISMRELMRSQLRAVQQILNGLKGSNWETLRGHKRCELAEGSVFVPTHFFIVNSNYILCPKNGNQKQDRIRGEFFLTFSYKIHQVLYSENLVAGCVTVTTLNRLNAPSNIAFFYFHSSYLYFFRQLSTINLFINHFLHKHSRHVWK